MDPEPRSSLEERLERAAREALAVTVGLAMLGLNRIQVERRRLTASLGCDAGSRRATDRA